MSSFIQSFKAAKGNSPKQVIERFAENHGLVYFGSVNQHDDEHQIVRGMTVSNSHTDSHYCIGTYQGYDTTFVERSDTVTGKEKKSAHTWHIMQVDLRTKVDLPHVFIGLHTHSESFYTQLFMKHSHLRPISVGAVYRHLPEFQMRYRVYAHAGKHIEVEKLLTPLVGEAFVHNFGALAIEITEGSVYIYSEHARVSEQLLHAMIENVTWLAGHIDAVSAEL